MMSVIILNSLFRMGVISLLIRNTIISNILLFGTMFQTIAISRFIYKITGNKYGHEEYEKSTKK